MIFEDKKIEEIKMKELKRPEWLEPWILVRLATEIQYTRNSKFHGCLILKSGNIRQGILPPKILSYGQNAERQSPFIPNQNTSMHAEMNAIHRLTKNRNRKRLIAVDIMIFRINRNGELRESLPCSLCMNCISQGLLQIGYTCRYIWFSKHTNDFLGQHFWELNETYQKARENGIGWGPQRDQTRIKITENIR